GTATFTVEDSPITGVFFDQVGVYTQRLTADDGQGPVFDEVTLTVLTETEPGLVGYWPLDRPGPVIDDRSGLQQDGAVVTEGPALISVLGQDGGALLFDGDENQAVVIADSPLLAPDPLEDDFSILLWIRVEPGAEGSILSRGAADPSQRHYQLFLSDPNGDGASDLNAIVGGETNDQAKQLGIQIDDGSWHHVALVHEAASGTNRLFIDGVPIGVPVPSGDAILDVSLILGARRAEADDTGIGFPLTGALDDVRFFFGRALSASEIDAVRLSADCLDGSCILFASDFESGDVMDWSSCSASGC
ncbi:MAG: LamG domain-containing protein, partial [Acidobacteriota bacterium]